MMRSISSRYTGPRNRKAFAKAARDREALRLALLEHARLHPLSRVTAAQLRELTGLRVSDRRIQQQVASIRIEAEIRELIEGHLGAPADPATVAEPHTVIDGV